MSRPTIAIIGTGFARYHAARVLARRMPHTEVVLVNPNRLLSLPPPAARGGRRHPRPAPRDRLHPREAAEGTPAAGVSGVRPARGEAAHVRRPGGRPGRAVLRSHPADHRKRQHVTAHPGVGKYAHGFRNIAEALYLRDHITRQIELADNTDDPEERAPRLTFVVVGAGYTGTEVTAQGALMTAALCKEHPRLTGQRVRWVPIDTAPRVLPGLGENLTKTADRVLRERGVEVRTKTSVAEAMDGCVRLSDDTILPTRSLIWCVGVRPEPLIAGLWTGAADPLHVPLSGLSAKIITRAYHLYSLPGNRGRTAASWLTESVFGRQGVQLRLVRGRDVPLDTDTPSGAVQPNA